MACVTRTTCGSKSSPACCRPFSACIAELSNRALLSQSIPQASIALWTCGQRQRSVAHMPTAATTATSDQNRLKSPTRLHDEAFKITDLARQCEPRRRLGTTFLCRAWSGVGCGSHGRQACRLAWGGANQEPLCVLLDLGPGQPLEVGGNIEPSRRAVESGEPTRHAG